MRPVSLREIITLCQMAYHQEQCVGTVDGHRWTITPIPARAIVRHDHKLLNALLSLPDRLTCAAVLCEDDSRPKPLRVLAYKGTTTANDWTANVRNHLTGVSAQHKAAIKLARDTPDVDLLVGHSLGGGLAAAASVATGIRAVTVNAATQSVLGRLIQEQGHPPYLRWATENDGIVNYVFKGDAIDARSGMPKLVLLGLLLQPALTIAAAAALSHTHIGKVVVLEGASSGKHGVDIHRLHNVTGGPFHQVVG
jgi:hypothetical protein